MVSEIFHRYGPVLNPDAKIEKQGGEIKAGSLYMRLNGGKIGLWNRFSEDGIVKEIYFRL